MWSIAKRELRLFFSSPIGYLILGTYLLVNGLLLWVFDSQYNVLSAGFGDLAPFFESAPLLLLFLIPALTMRSFAEERSDGTLELLLTKPITPYKIIMGKFLGIFLLVLCELLPTLTNLIAVNELLQDSSFIDWGSMGLSYLGLLLVCSVFISIGISTSIRFNSQVTAFMVALLICFFHFYGWGFIADTLTSNNLYNFVLRLGIQEHYYSISRGVLVFEDVWYFALNCFIFIYFTRNAIKQIQK